MAAERTLRKMSQGTVHEKALKTLMDDVIAGRKTMTDLYVMVKSLSKELNARNWKKNIYFLRELAAVREPYEKEWAEKVNEQDIR